MRYERWDELPPGRPALSGDGPHALARPELPDTQLVQHAAWVRILEMRARHGDEIRTPGRQHGVGVVDPPQLPRAP